MYKTTILLIVIAVLCLGILLYFIPWQTRVDVTLNAIKFDEDLNEVGSSQIVIQGNRLDYLFRTPALDVNISSFDKYSVIKASSDASGNEGTISASPWGEYLTVGYGAYIATQNSMAFLKVYFSPEYDRWVIRSVDDEGTFYYLADTNSELDMNEFISYFKGVMPGSWEP